MPIARFQMPDGRVGRFEVPEGTTAESAQTMIEQHISGSQGQKSYDALNTKLSPEQETGFQQWKQKNAPRDSGEDYDLRGAFLKGYTPSPENGHFPDEFKKPNHPTFSDQSKFAKDYPDLAGHWASDNKTYIPPRGKIPMNTEMRQGNADFMANPTDAVNPVNDPSKMAGMGTQAIASLPTDMKTRAQYFAKQRFPDDPNAISKYGVQQGRLFYQGDDGKMYFEEPEASLNPSEMAKYAASSAGPALPVAGGIVGGVTSAPAGGIPGAAIGAAEGDVVRQGLAAALAGEKDFKPTQTAKEAALSAGGQGVGAGVGKFLNRNAVRGVEKTMTPEAQAEIAAMQQKSAETGIPLTPAEITNLPSLKSQQNTLGSLPRSAEPLQDFYQKRNVEQVPAAVDDMLGKISGTQSAEAGATSLRTGSQGVIKAEMGERAAAAKPYYDKSRQTAIPAKEYQELMKDPFIRQQANAVKGNPKYQSDIGDLFPKAGKQEVAPSSTPEQLLTQGLTGAKPRVKPAEPPVDAKIGFLDVVKRRIDGLIETAKTTGNRNDVRIYTKAKEKLTGTLDRLSPDYAKARSIFEEGSPPVTALTKGEVGMAAKAGETNLDRIPKLIFDSGPDAVKANRAAFVKAGKENEWNDGLRSYLSENFSRASKEFKSGNSAPGAGFRASIYGTPKQKAAMRNAMSDDQWAGFNRLMDVLEASGRVTQGGSRTAFAGESIAEMKQQAGGLVSKTLRAASPSNLFDTSRMAKAYEQMRLGQHSEALADIITSPDAMKQLKALKALPPNSVKAMSIVGQLLDQYGASSVSKPKDVPAGGF